MNNEAALLLNRLAEHVVNKKPLHAGSRSPETFAVAGMSKEVLSFSHKYLRLYDVGGSPASRGGGEN